MPAAAETPIVTDIEGLTLTADAPGTALRRPSQVPSTDAERWRRLCADLSTRAEQLRRLRDDIGPRTAALDQRTQ